MVREMRKDILHQQLTSTNSKQIRIEAALDLFNRLKREILVLNYQVPDLFKSKTCHLILAKMSGAKSRNLVSGCTRKKSEKRKKKHSRK